MIKTSGIYHTSIPVDDMDRAVGFYTEVLGLKMDGPPREGARLSRLKCGEDTVVLFLRPKPLKRDSHKEDGVYHQAFEMDVNDFDDAVETLKKAGAFNEIIERDSGRTIYFWDTEGNYEELHAGTPQS